MYALVTITLTDGTTTSAPIPPLTASWLVEQAAQLSAIIKRALTPAEIAALELVAAHQQADLRRGS